MKREAHPSCCDIANSHWSCGCYQGGGSDWFHRLDEDDVAMYDAFLPRVRKSASWVLAEQLGVIVLTVNTGDVVCRA